MENSTAAIWRHTFSNWPPQFRRKGVLIPSFGEPTPFVDFVMTHDLLVLERATPDNAGARRVAIPFALIEALKYTEPMKTEQLLNAGFTKGASEPAPQPRVARPLTPAAPAPPAATSNPAPPPSQTT